VALLTTLVEQGLSAAYSAGGFGVPEGIYSTTAYGGGNYGASGEGVRLWLREWRKRTYGGFV